MRIFVYGTGRCGTVSFAHACSFITNYTCQHEEQNQDLLYDDSHIAINPQFRVIGQKLSRMYKGSLGVWMSRNFADVVQSYTHLNRGAWLRHWSAMYSTILPAEAGARAEYAVHQMLRDCQDTETAFLKHGRNARVRLEHIKTDFLAFWQMIDAKGDLDAALASWDTPHNTNKERNKEPEASGWQLRRRLCT